MPSSSPPLRTAVACALLACAPAFLSQLRESAYTATAHATPHPRPQPHHLGHAHTTHAKQRGLIQEWLHPHEPTMWERIVDRMSVHTHKPSTWERLFGDTTRETWWSWLTGRAVDGMATRSFYTRTWAQRLRMSMRIAWVVVSQMLTNGVDVAVFCYDVLAFMLLWDQIRSALFGPSNSASVMLRVGRVAERALDAVLGGGNTSARERIIRLVLCCTVLLPVVAAALLFLVLPSMLFAVAAKNAVPLGLGFVTVGLAHALQHRPLSWFINSTAIVIILNCVRIIAAVLMYFVAQSKVVRSVARWHGAKGRMKERLRLSEQQQPQGNVGAPMTQTVDLRFTEPAPPGVPSTSSSTMMAAMTTGNKTGAGDVLQWFDSNLARLSQIVSRADQIIERASARLSTGSANKEEVQDAAPEDDGRPRTRSGGQVLDHPAPNPNEDIAQAQEVQGQDQPVEQHVSKGHKSHSHGGHHRRNKRRNT